MSMFDFFSERRLLLAPMAGVSDEAFRTLCREQGAADVGIDLASLGMGRR